MKILVLCGDHWHPKAGIIEGLTPIFQPEWQVDFITDAGEIKPEVLANYDVVMITKADEIAPDNYKTWKTAKNQQALVDYVEAGGGLFILHAGVVSGKEAKVYAQLIGCRFLYHPRDNNVTIAPLKPHPICEAVAAFTTVDEHYWIDILRDDIDIIFAASSPAQGVKEKYESAPYDNCPPTVYPSGYTCTQGKGRICVLTPGHKLPVWHHEMYQKTIKNALKWLTFTT